jgi:hypothetical protein
MGFACLAVIYPFDPVREMRVPVRVCSADDRRVTGLGGFLWEPALTDAPSIGMALFNGDFTNAVQPGGAALQIAMNVVKQNPAHERADRLIWIGAPVEIHAEEIGAKWPWRKRFVGIVRGFNRRGQTLTLNAEIDKEAFDKNILTATYAGTGDAEGGDDIKNQLKPLVIGWAMNVEPVLINAVDNVYQFSGYGPIEGVTTLFERGSAYGSPLADYADYNALVAATIAAGLWGTCLAEGMIRLGAPAYGLLTADIKGHVGSGGVTPRLTGDVIELLADIAGVDAGRIDTQSLADLDTAVPYSINLVLREQVAFAEMAQALALPCNAQGGVSLAGEFFVSRVSLEQQASFTLEAAGRSLPQVKESTENDVSPPYRRTVMGANRNWRVHSADEISFYAQLVERGLYDDAETYREGNTVSKSDGSTWLYINGVATSGNAPPPWPDTSNAYWSNLTPPISAENLTYVDGTPFEDLKPSGSGADSTATVLAVGSGIDKTISEDLQTVTLKNIETFQFALSDMATALATGTLKAGWIVPYDCTLIEVFTGLSAAQSSSGVVTVDALLAGSTIFSTKPSIDASEDTSLTGTAAVLSTTAATKGQKLTFSIDAAGTGAKGLIATISVKRT